MKMISYSTLGGHWLQCVSRTDHVHILYHACCLDGMTSAVVFKNFLNSVGHRNISFLPVSYGSNVPSIEKDSHVVIVDFSYPIEKMIGIQKRAKSLLVIDHHVTAVNAILTYKSSIPVEDMFDYFLSVDGTNESDSGASLVAKFTIPDKGLGFIALAREHDLWKHDGNPESPALALNRWFNDVVLPLPAWDAFAAIEKAMYIDAALVTAVEHGRSILGEEVKAITANIDANAVAYKWKGYRVMFCPSVKKDASMTGTLLCKRGDFSATYFQRPDGKVEYSLRSPRASNIDVSVWAKEAGGGGHMHAAGFVLEPDTYAFFQLGTEVYIK